MPAISHADIKVELPKDAKGKTLVMQSINVSDFALRRPQITTDSIVIKKNKFDIPTAAWDKAKAVSLAIGDESIDNIILAPGENAIVNIKSLSPFDYTLSGTALIEGINNLDRTVQPILEEFRNVRDGKSDADPEALENQYLQAAKDFIDSNLESPAAPYALTLLNGQDFLDYYTKVSAQIEKSMFKDMLQSVKERTEAMIEKEKAQQKMQDGHTDAPDFTLKNLDGKDVSLSDFRGKWVVVDFWGSWCGWCIKGFPELKKAYEKYAGKIEVIGVDCGDTPEAWRAAVEKFKLPWVNVYNPQGNDGPDQTYKIQGFPTKAIITPEGKIARIVTGEDPEFYTILDKLVNQ